MANYDAETLDAPPVLFGEKAPKEGSLSIVDSSILLALRAKPLAYSAPNARSVVAFAPPPGTLPVYPDTRTPPDANDVVVWVADEPDGTNRVKNYGVGGSKFELPNILLYNDFPKRSPSLFGLGLDTTHLGSSGFQTSAPGTSRADLRIQVPITVSGWILLRAIPANNHSPVAKAYRPQGSWLSPWVSWHWMVVRATGGTSTSNWYVVLTIAGSQNVFEAGTARRLSHAVWHHVGWTWDGLTFKLYLDGDEIRRDAVIGSIDFGTDGPYQFGSDVAGAVDAGPSEIHDVRIANIVRPASYFRDLYNRAVGQFGAS